MISKSAASGVLSGPTRLRRRLVMAITLTALAVLTTWLMATLQEASLWRSSFVTGFLLLGCLFFLTAYNLRKKLAFLPILGTSRWWMQLHIYVALFSIAVFGIHINWSIPTGVFERWLAGLYTLVAGSGIYGLYLTRTVPRRLTATGREVIYEQIPVRRAHLASRARELVLESVHTTDVLARFYVNRLARFMERPRSPAYFVRPSLRNARISSCSTKTASRSSSNSSSNIEY